MAVPYEYIPLVCDIGRCPAPTDHFFGTRKRPFPEPGTVFFRFYNKCWGQAMSLAPLL